MFVLQKNNFVVLVGPHLHTLIYTYCIYIGEGAYIISTLQFIAPTHTFRGNFKLVWLTASACVSVSLCHTEQSESFALRDV